MQTWNLVCSKKALKIDLASNNLLSNEYFSIKQQFMKLSSSRVMFSAHSWSQASDGSIELPGQCRHLLLVWQITVCVWLLGVWRSVHVLYLQPQVQWIVTTRVMELGEGAVCRSGLQCCPHNQDVWGRAVAEQNDSENFSSSKSLGPLVISKFTCFRDCQHLPYHWLIFCK